MNIVKMVQWKKKAEVEDDHEESSSSSKSISWYRHSLLQKAFSPLQQKWHKILSTLFVTPIINNHSENKN